MVEETFEQIDAGLYRVQVPLPKNPLKATNSYIIKAERRNLIIDTGMNREECRSVILKALEELEIALENTDIFVSHLHVDHLGLADDLSRGKSLVYFNRPDARVLRYEGLWVLASKLAKRHGFPGELVEKAIDSHPGQRFSPKEPIDFTMVDDNNVLDYGNYKLQCISTPGHTEGHTCLFDPDRKYFFSGDHILGDITPNISTWRDDGNPLGEYFKSLDRVAEMPVEFVLPGHRSLFSNCRGRIDQLKNHHRQRLKEVLEILKASGPCSAFTVASQMSWDLLAASWEDFPLMQKWFASGEALAHIRYLEVEGKVKREEADNAIYFSLA
ncbi:MAG: MBL fold metallo-hydrolase [Bacillota bacterium]